jgi:hypothetical protein
VGGEQLRIHARGFTNQRIEHVAGAMRIGEELAVGFLVQRDAEPGEEGDRVGDGQAAQHLSNDAAPSAPEIAIENRAVGDVAAAAAADEDFRAWLPGAIEHENPEIRARTADEDGGSQPRGAGADHQDVARRGDRIDRQRRQINLAGHTGYFRDTNESVEQIYDGCVDFGRTEASRGRDSPPQRRRLKLNMIQKRLSKVWGVQSCSCTAAAGVPESRWYWPIPA